MFFQLKELLRWLGITVLEILLALVAFLAFSVLLVIKVEQQQSQQQLEHSGTGAEQAAAAAANQQNSGIPWPWVFAPLYISDALNGYFVTIVLIRMYIEGCYKSAFLRFFWSLFLLCMLGLFKYLLCQKLSGDATYEYSEVLSPVFILLQLVMVRACQLN